MIIHPDIVIAQILGLAGAATDGFGPSLAADLGNVNAQFHDVILLVPEWRGCCNVPSIGEMAPWSESL